ncbi:TolB family protein, partial [Candidatus Poribacteria bacterium]
MAKSNSLAEPRYLMPPKAIADLVDAPITPDVSASPNQDWILIMEQPSLPPISELAQPELKLAGLRINPRNNGSSRSSYSTSLALKSLVDNTERPIAGLPSDARISSVTWSPDSRLIAFTNNCDSEIQLWLAEVDSGVARRLTDTKLSSAYGRPFCWLSDSQKVLCKAVPSDRGFSPEEPGVPGGPVIQENTGKKAPIHTYQDLLKNAHDEALLEHYLTTQIMMVSISGESRIIGSSSIIGQAVPSPNGCYIFVETIHRPFSYLVPIGRFPRWMEIWDMAGKVIREVADLPLAEEIPIDFDAVPVGPRSISWRADTPATLYWAEAQDEGDPKVETDIRDKVFMLPHPFRQEAIRLASLGYRFSNVRWGTDSIALVSERWW